MVFNWRKDIAEHLSGYGPPENLKGDQALDYLEAFQSMKGSVPDSLLEYAMPDLVGREAREIAERKWTAEAEVEKWEAIAEEQPDRRSEALTNAKIIENRAKADFDEQRIELAYALGYLVEKGYETKLMYNQDIVRLDFDGLITQTSGVSVIDLPHDAGYYDRAAYEELLETFAKNEVRKAQREQNRREREVGHRPSQLQSSQAVADVSRKAPIDRFDESEAGLLHRLKVITKVKEDRVPYTQKLRDAGITKEFFEKAQDILAEADIAETQQKLDALRLQNKSYRPDEFTMG